MADVVERLLPCPFCGGTNIDPEGWASTERKGPACDDCAGCADTVELWNSRPLSQAGAGGGVVEIDGVARNEALKSYKNSIDNGYSPRAAMDGAIREYLTRAALALRQLARRLSLFLTTPATSRKSGTRLPHTSRPTQGEPRMTDIKDELKVVIDAFNFQPGSMVYDAYAEIISLRHRLTPPATPVQPTASVEAVARIICRRVHEALSGDWRPGELEQKVNAYWPHYRKEAGEILALIHSAPSAPVSAPSPAGGVREALRALYEWYDRDGSVGGASEVFEQHRAVLSSPATPEPVSAPAGEVVRRVRHKKRGTTYQVLGDAEAQVSTGAYRVWPSDADKHDGDGHPARLAHDGLSLTVYRSEQTGKLWCRFPDEFEDGRFEKLPALSNAPGHGEGGL